jgi:uncharacterized protein YyaL (SSP411 family)
MLKHEREQLAALDDARLPLPGLPDPSSNEAEQILRSAWSRRQVDGEDEPEFVNRLVLEQSPYLLQHADNPVNWFPWGDRAFELARAQDKPILLSVGYSTCHWCHVMAHESFEDPEVAAVINEHFVPVKVDREERPDVDGVYMNAVQAMRGRGGWPMTVVMNAEGEPFFAATYLPARDGDRGASHGLMTVLRQLAGAWRHDRGQVDEQAERITEHLRRAAGVGRGDGMPDGRVVSATVEQLMESYDAQWGGFGGAPKFPQVSMLMLLLSHGYLDEDDDVLDAIKHTLDAMANGGVYDQVSGGFHRYSVDQKWLVPHFEKMLYDNGQMAELYLRASQVLDEPELERIGVETLDYLLREMLDESGGFYSATDADSATPTGHQEEGYFFTWTLAEIEDALDEEDRELATQFYSVKPGGNFEGRSILHVATSRAAFARAEGMSKEALDEKLSRIDTKLRTYREEHRAQPHLDDKVITAWNGLVLSALAAGYEVVGDERYLDAAQTLAAFLLDDMRRSDGTLARRYRDGETRIDGFLDDYAFTIRGLLGLFEVDPDARWLAAAEELQSVLDAQFFDSEEGRYYLTADAGEELIVRQKPLQDGAEPSGNSVALDNLIRLHAWTDDDQYRSRYEQLLVSLSAIMERAGQAVPGALRSFQLASGRFLQVALTRGERFDAMSSVFRDMWLPHAVHCTAPAEGADDELVEHVPWLEEKQSLDGAATAYVCEHGSCELPVTTPEAFVGQLES